MCTAPKPKERPEVDRDYQKAREEAKHAIHQAREQIDISWFEAAVMRPDDSRRRTRRHLEGDANR